MAAAILYPCIVLFISSESKSKKWFRPPVPMSASYTSTIAEELISLLRTLHSLDEWSPVINSYIMAQLSKVTAFAQVCS
jgi:E3 ubiquitin-protein ligase HERC2